MLDSGLILDQGAKKEPTRNLNAPAHDTWRYAGKAGPPLPAGKEAVSLAVGNIEKHETKTLPQGAGFHGRHFKYIPRKICARLREPMLDGEE